MPYISQARCVQFKKMIYDYNPNITVEEYKEALSKLELTKTEILILSILYSSEKHTATGVELKDKLNKPHNGIINLAFANIAKKIATITEKLPVSNRKNGKYRWWSLLAIGEKRKDGLFAWQLRPEFVEALEQENTLTRDNDLYAIRPVSRPRD